MTRKDIAYFIGAVISTSLFVTIVYGIIWGLLEVLSDGWNYEEAFTLLMVLYVMRVFDSHYDIIRGKRMR